MHAVLAGCPRLRWLGADLVLLKGPAGALFRDMQPHAALRAIVLPMAARKHLAAYTAHLCQRCPSLREIEANVMRPEDADLVAACARSAAGAGVRRFICEPFFAEAGSDGESGSDGGAGEYIGNGDVIPVVTPVALGDLMGGYILDEEEEFDSASLISDTLQMFHDIARRMPADLRRAVLHDLAEIDADIASKVA